MLQWQIQKLRQTQHYNMGKNNYRWPNINNTWKTLEWQKKSDAFTKDEKCIWCNTTEKLAPNHPRRKGGYTHEDYMDLENSCIIPTKELKRLNLPLVKTKFILCTKCNFMYDKGYLICLCCRKHYYKPRRDHDKTCWHCFIQTPYGKSIHDYYILHPEELKKKMRKKKWLQTQKQ